MKNVKPLDRANSDRFDEADESRSDWTRLRTMSDDDVEAAVGSSDDENGMLVDWQNARLVTPTRKESMTIRLDADILAHYRGLGRGYQTTINAVLAASWNTRTRRTNAASSPPPAPGPPAIEGQRPPSPSAR